MKEKLICPNCWKIMVEGETKKLGETLREDVHIQCPYCRKIYANPYFCPKN